MLQAPLLAEEATSLMSFPIRMANICQAAFPKIDQEGKESSRTLSSAFTICGTAHITRRKAEAIPAQTRGVRGWNIVKTDLKDSASFPNLTYWVHLIPFI